MLELFYFRGRYILGVEDAVYSDGDRYRPLVAAFRSPVLKPVLADVKEVLVLGTGLASAVHVLQRYGHRPRFRLVEIDRQVLDWAVEFLPPGTTAEPICTDAFDFIESDRGRYDLIVVDLFFGRKVPDGVLQQPFLAACRLRLAPGGRLVLNYMVEEERGALRAREALQSAFDREVKEIAFGINRVYIV